MKPVRILFREFLLLAVLPLFCVAGQKDSIPVERLKFQKLTIDNGLSQGMVTAIVQDKNGFMWFATKDGLNKFDGYTFKVYRHDLRDTLSLADNFIHSVISDPKGLLWIQFTNGEMDIFNPATETAWHLSRYFPLLKSKYPLSRRIMQRLSGPVFVQERMHYFKVEANEEKDGGRFGYRVEVSDLSSFLPARKTIDFPTPFIASSKEFYIVFNDSVFIYPDPDLSKRMPPRVLPAGLVIAHCLDPLKCGSIEAEDTVRHMLLSICYGIFSLTDTRTGKRIKTVEPGGHFRQLYIRSAGFDNLGRIWLLTIGELFLYDPSTDKFCQITATDPSIPDGDFNYATSFCTDRSGVVWIGTPGFGLMRYSNRVERFHHITGNGKENYVIQGIWEDTDKNRIWLKRAASLTTYDRKSKIFSDPFSSRPQERTGLLHIDGRPADARSAALWKPANLAWGNGFLPAPDGYWLLNEPFLCYLDKDLNVVRRMKSSLAMKPYLGTTFIARNGVTWMATGLDKELSLHRLDEDSDTILRSIPFPVRESTNAYPFTSAIVDDSVGNLWIGTMAGLYRFDPVREEWKSYVHQDDDTASLPVNMVFSLYMDAQLPGTLWVGTNGGGLVRFDCATGKGTAFTTRTGLPNDVIYGILPDNKGYIWMSTNQGIARMNKVTAEVRTFTVKDGLQSNEFNRYASCVLSDGNLVFGGMNGLNIFDPDEISDYNFQPQVNFTGIKIGNREVALHAWDLQKENPVFTDEGFRLRYNQNFIAFSFASADYSATDKLRYKYRLDGLDTDWLPVTRLNEATYTNLDPGSYTFRVRGTNSDGVWSDHEASINIFIIPPWWKTWWFRAVAVLLVAAGIYTFYRDRLREAIRLMALRNRIASDLHDEIGSTLSSISLYSEAAKRMLDGNDRATRVLAKINTNTSEMMEAMSDIVWAINSRNDKLDNLVNRMRSFAVQVSEACKFRLHLAENKDLPVMPLDMFERKNMYLIFKEAVNNAAKYSACKNLWIVFSSRNHILEMRIRDDGNGFHPETAGSERGENRGGNGLVNMRKRAEDLNGTLSIVSSPGQGTEIILNVPLK